MTDSVPVRGSPDPAQSRTPDQVTQFPGGTGVVEVLNDGTYTTVLINPRIRGRWREQILAAARVGGDLDPQEAHLARVVEYGVPDRDGNGSGEVIVLLTTITDPAEAAADELADAYHQRWEEETGNDQLKTHLRGPGRVPRSRLPDLVRQEIWAWLTVHYALAVLTARAAEAADLDPIGSASPAPCGSCAVPPPARRLFP
ncbi:MAG TPA: hypothetical protein VEO01_30045 [Pseudonocardiaceae bacterium]|nr:hypothetical protein [Pseudonocardiaceae bacterium]